MEEICRLCRKGSEVFLEPIFDYRDGTLIADLIMKICPLQILPETGLPSMICDECLEITMSAVLLQKTSIDSDNFFRSQLGKLEDVVVKKEKSEHFAVKIESFEDEEEFKFDDFNTRDSSDDDSNLFESPQKPVVKKSETYFTPRELPSSKNLPPQEKWFQCNFCEVKLKPRSNMMRHMKRLHDPIAKPFSCLYCVQRFEDEGALQSHVLSRHKNETPSTIFCEICGASGNHPEGMKRHIHNDHKVRRTKSKLEVHSSDDETRVRRRYKYKFNPKPVPGYEFMPYDEVWWQCNFCHKQLKPRKSILRHIRLKHDPESFPFGCRFCIERFETADFLDDHVSSKHSEDEDMKPTTIFCDICGISGETKLGMDNHKKDDHLLPVFTPELKEVEVVPKHDIPVLTVRKRQDDFFNPRALANSEHLKYEDIYYQCSFCDKQLKPRRVMLRHMRLKHDPASLPFGCRFCIKRFSTAKELQQHEDKFHEFEELSMVFCDFCGASGTSKEGMEVHLTDDHLRSFRKEEKLSFLCSKCDIGFEKKEQLEQHNSLHHVSKMVKCNKLNCSERFRDKLTLRNHVMSFHDKLFRALTQDEVEQDLSCCACSEVFPDENELLIHVETHRPDFTDVSSQKCVHCPIPVKTFDIFMKHVKYHMKAKTHQCNQCLKIFSFDGKFICHVNSHKRNHRKKMSCDQCGSKFRNGKELEIHEKVKHNNETLFICPICAKSLGSATILDNHIKFVHHGDVEKKHECRVCSLKFTHRSKLVRHEATHSKVRPHVCELCGAGFKMKEGLTIHMKRHAGTLVKNHHCTQCSYKFTTQHRLNVHLLTHTGAKPNACEYCDRAYASKGDLVKHLQKVHVGSAVYKCDKCELAFPRVVELREHQTLHSKPI